MKILKLFILLLPAISYAQDGIPYLEFKLRQSGKQVDVRWTIEAGNTCQDVEVWRGRDSLSMKSIYTYPGICGDNDSVKVYNYLDDPPSGGSIYFYQLRIISDRSRIKSIRSAPKNIIEVYPNPANTQITIIREREVPVDAYNFYSDTGALKYTIKKPEVEEYLDLTFVKENSLFLITSPPEITNPVKILIR